MTVVPISTGQSFRPFVGRHRTSVRLRSLSCLLNLSVPAAGRDHTPRGRSVVNRASPTVQRRRLGTELRRHREAAGVTIEFAAGRLECSSSKISRMETGHIGASPRDVRDLLTIYGVDGDSAEELIQV